MERLVFPYLMYIPGYDTLQFDDYSKVVAEAFDPAAKKQRREQVFPRDCDAAFDLGARLVTG